MKKLSKAQQLVVDKLKNKSMLFGFNPTWFQENVFFRNSNDSYERSNLKVVRTMLSKNLLVELETNHFLVKQYDLNLKELAEYGQ